jgi:hypothetical protein
MTILTDFVFDDKDYYRIHLVYNQQYSQQPKHLSNSNLMK